VETERNTTKRNGSILYQKETIQNGMKKTLLKDRKGISKESKNTVRQLRSSKILLKSKASTHLESRVKAEKKKMQKKRNSLTYLLKNLKK